MWSSIKTVVCKIETEYGHDLAEVTFNLVDLRFIVHHESICAKRCFDRTHRMIIVMILVVGYCLDRTDLHVVLFVFIVPSG